MKPIIKPLIMKNRKVGMTVNSKGKGAMLVVTSFAVANIAAILGLVLFVAVRLSVCRVQRKASTNFKSCGYIKGKNRPSNKPDLSIYRQISIV